MVPSPAANRCVPMGMVFESPHLRYSFFVIVPQQTDTPEKIASAGSYERTADSGIKQIFPFSGARVSKADTEHLECGYVKKVFLPLVFLSVGCGDASPANKIIAADPYEELSSPTQTQAVAMSCNVPDRPVVNGPSTTTPWELVTLNKTKFPKALCNDGTPGVYIIRRNEASTKWLIHLQGGGNCYDSDTCSDRWDSDGAELMSSTQETQDAANGVYKFPNKGIFSNVQTANPTFHDANIVRISYCSSDLWSGDHEGNSALPTTDVGRWHFRGREIITAVVRDLIQRKGLSTATDIVYSGGSAGGGGVYNTMDDFAQQIPFSARIIGMPDAAFRFNHPSYDPVTQEESTAVPTDQRVFIEIAAANWGGRGDASCEAAATNLDEQLSCREGAFLTTHGHIATPMLIVNNQYDHNALADFGVDLTKDGKVQNTSEQGYAQRYAARMRDLLGQLDSIHSSFAEYGYLHVTTSTNALTTSLIDGVALKDAIDQFYRRPCTTVRRVEAPVSNLPEVL